MRENFLAQNAEYVAKTLQGFQSSKTLIEAMESVNIWTHKATNAESISHVQRFAGLMQFIISFLANIIPKRSFTHSICKLVKSYKKQCNRVCIQSFKI